MEQAQASEPSAEVAGSTEFHVACNRFRGQDSDQLQRWLAAEVDSVPVQKMVKKRQWTFAFVSVQEEHSAKFQELMGGLKYKGGALQVNLNSDKDSARAGGKRPASDAAGDAPKRRKSATGDAAEAGNERVPTLKDLRDRAKNTKRSFAGSALEKSAPLMQWDYDTQLNMKNVYVKSAVRSFVKHALKRCEKLGREPPAWCSKEWSLAAGAPQGCCCTMDPPVGAPEESLRGWRNKCEFTIGNNEAGEIDVGFILKILPDGGQVVGSVQDVPLVPAKMQRLCTVAASLVASSPFPVYDRRECGRKGVWRTLLARINPSGDMLVMVQTTTLSDEDRKRFVDAFVDKVTSEDLGVTSVYLIFNDEVTDATRPTAKAMHVHGKPRLEMPMLGLKLEVGPLSFFNPNTTTCTFLMETAIKYLRLNKTEILLDIFCGIGTIGLCASQYCAKVIGVDIVEDNIEDARQNALRNEISNTEFLAGKAEDLVPKILGDMDPSLEVVAVVDPSRAGLHPRLVEILRGRTQVSRIVYISCNVESMAEDVAKLGTSTEEEADDFVPVSTVAVDSFPQTMHIEAIQLVERASRVKDPRTSTAAGAEKAQTDGS